MLYLAGPMSGYPDHNFTAFVSAEQVLYDAGHVVANPATAGQVDDWTWEQYLRRSLRQMLRCDAVATLPEWMNSKGACLEVDVARQVAMPVRPVASWL